MADDRIPLAMHGIVGSIPGLSLQELFRIRAITTQLYGMSQLVADQPKLHRRRHGQQLRGEEDRRTINRLRQGACGGQTLVRLGTGNDRNMLKSGPERPLKDCPPGPWQIPDDLPATRRERSLP